MEPRITLRLIQRLLGAFWLLDGLLQLQPFMFTRGFLDQTIAAAGQGQPALIALSVSLAIQIVGPHVALWNAGFATIQLLIGLG
ncbi:MAG: hypothetical protein WAM30_20170, partial [Candidatus Dormiibacterota bacterium]